MIHREEWVLNIQHQCPELMETYKDTVNKLQTINKRIYKK